MKTNIQKDTKINTERDENKHEDMKTNIQKDMRNIKT